MKLKAHLLLLALLFASGSAPANAAVKGQVKTGTAGAPLPSNQAVQVVHLTAKGDELQRATVTAGADGSFSYDEAAQSGSKTILSTVHQDVTYSAVQEAEASGSPTITIFETTEDPKVIEIESDTTTLFRGDKDEIEVLQLTRLVNRSDKTFVGAALAMNAPASMPPLTRAVIGIPLPAEAFDLAPSEAINPAGITATALGPASTSPVLPGKTTLGYVFKVKAGRTGWQLQRDIFYSTSRADLLIGPGLRLVAGPGFTLQAKPKLGGVSYSRYRSTSLKPGPAAFQAAIRYDDSSGAGLNTGLAIGLGGLAALLAGVALVMRKRKSQLGVGSTPSQERDKLIQQVAELDEQFESGSVSEGEYSARRAELKSELAKKLG